MSGHWIVGGTLLVAAALPLLLLAVVQVLAYLLPAAFRRVAEVERRHYGAYWSVTAAVYAMAGVTHLVTPEGLRVFGILFLLLAAAAVARALRGAE